MSMESPSSNPCALRRAAMALALAGLVLGESGCATPGVSAEAESWSGGELRGRVLDEAEQPVAGALVYLYAEGRSQLGPADAMSDGSAPDGSFSVLAPPGEYSVVARRRASGAVGGALRTGDVQGRLPGTVRLVSGEDVQRTVRVSTFQAESEGDPRRTLSTSTRISGVVRDRVGGPVKGAHAFAYEVFSQSRPPDFLSPPTDAQGRFDLSLPSGGSYVIGARTGTRGRPGADDLMGFWGGREARHAVSEGQVVEGVEIVLEAYGRDAPPAMPPLP